MFSVIAVIVIIWRLLPPRRNNTLTNEEKELINQAFSHSAKPNRSSTSPQSSSTKPTHSARNSQSSSIRPVHSSLLPRHKSNHDLGLFLPPESEFGIYNVAGVAIGVAMICVGNYLYPAQKAVAVLFLSQAATKSAGAVLAASFIEAGVNVVVYSVSEKEFKVADIGVQTGFVFLGMRVGKVFGSTAKVLMKPIEAIATWDMKASDGIDIIWALASKGRSKPPALSFTNSTTLKLFAKRMAKDFSVRVTKNVAYTTLNNLVAGKSVNFGGYLEYSTISRAILRSLLDNLAHLPHKLRSVRYVKEGLDRARNSAGAGEAELKIWANQNNVRVVVKNLETGQLSEYGPPDSKDMNYIGFLPSASLGELGHWTCLDGSSTSLPNGSGTDCLAVALGAEQSSLKSLLTPRNLEKYFRGTTPGILTRMVGGADSSNYEEATKQRTKEKEQYDKKYENTHFADAVVQAGKEVEAKLKSVISSEDGITKEMTELARTKLFNLEGAAARTIMGENITGVVERRVTITKNKVKLVVSWNVDRGTLRHGKAWETAELDKPYQPPHIGTSLQKSSTKKERPWVGHFFMTSKEAPPEMRDVRERENLVVCETGSVNGMNFEVEIQRVPHHKIGAVKVLKGMEEVNGQQ
ncbi:hypothetical protein BCR33DRAFT_735045 [Rhizoclosmatium globosum]|uniref:Uncharacterized protein n=1 Tax=Rhizoclosmatium globosum TaxID=329046 RepID=A0A1Y2CRZ5_9FUNG|nr:hypothetical protein BCR33DRAFT_735045 [Rhizoclosmatium globosum]|eukprot:ORY49624.1 hypothetical protein BCR33DRAFT_735045 [Rhizoclosmatium globosum]